MATLPEIGRVLYPLTSSDQDRIYQNNINHTYNENTEKHQLRDHPLIQYQILRTNIIKVVQQIVRRITNEIISIKGIKRQFN